MPLVSVIVPNYNHARYLSKRIDSILQQTFKDIEIILLDDCSTDNSREILEKYRNNSMVSHIIFNKENSASPYIQWNKGAGLATGKYLWIAESDDYADTNLLNELVLRMEADERLGLAYCQTKLVNNKEEVLRVLTDYTDILDKNIFLKDFKMNGLEFIEKYLIYICTIANASGTLIRNSIFREVGGANPQIKICADWLLYLSILLKSNIAYCSAKLNYRRSDDRSVTASLTLPWDAYHLDLREQFNELLLFQKNSNEKNKISNRNFKLMKIDQSNFALWEIRRGKIWRGWRKIINAFIYIHQPSYLFHGLYWTKERILHKNKIDTSV